MKTLFQKILKTPIISVKPVSGGDINEAYKIETKENIFFAKTNSDNQGKDMLSKEALGLKLLKEKAKINIPEVVLNDNIGDKAIIILKWVDSGYSNKNTSLSIAKQLVNLHKSTSLKFGLEYDNFIGSLSQPNKQMDNWLEFYHSNRIEFQLKLAIDSHLLNSSLISKMERMFYYIDRDFPDFKPSLLHGDLWSGNYMINSDGNCVFIDPAVYYGHREVDFAMMRLFGGFDNDVFEIYNEHYPFEYNHQDRIKFYQLYYILVHVNLFGRGYTQSAIDIITYYSG